MEFKFLLRNGEAQKKATEWVQNDACNFRLSPKYRLYYRVFRPWMPIWVRQLLQRRSELQERWYEPNEFMRSMTVCLESAEQEMKTIHPWPSGAKFAFVLTHDVETYEGMKHVSRIADTEEKLGFRSSWNLVPYKYKIDMGLVSDLRSRGFEIGIHGYNHDGRLYGSRKQFDHRASRDQPGDQAIWRGRFSVPDGSPKPGVAAGTGH